MRHFLSFSSLILLLAACGSPQRSQRKAEAALAIGEYATAAQHYKRAYQLTSVKERSERGRLAFLMGECYRRYGNVSRALGGYRTAERYKFTDTTTLLRIGQMLLLQGDYRAAERALLAYQEAFPQDTAVEAALRSCGIAPRLKTEGSLYTVRLATPFNSSRSDFSPALVGSDKELQLYFTSTRTSALGDEISGITAQKAADLFVAKRNEQGKWTLPEPLPEAVNSLADEGTPAFSPDGKTLYFTHCGTHPQYPRLAAIYKSSRSEASWGKAQEVKLSKDTLSSYAHPALSPDGRWLYFTSDMPGGYGGFDLWRADLRPGDGQGLVENLGASVNTAGDEKFPYCRADGSLYFSSDGRETMGGLDLYRAQEDSTTHRWQLEHLPAPINSHADDFGITFEGLHHRGYFSSSRGTNGRGWDKIYEFSYPETLLTAKGWVYEQDGYELPAAVVQIIGSDGTNIKLPVKSDGSFEHKLRPGVDYLYMASCRGFLNFPNRLHADSIAREHQYVLQFPLPSLSIPVLVRNVFYEFDKADLTPESTEALDRLARLLTENSHITIELAAHTDHRGSEAYNLNLSQRRAESVVRYLKGKGIASDRLTAKGYGETQPKVVNKKLLETHAFLHQGDTLTTAYIDSLSPTQQDSCHALNRRTEFRVLRTTYGLFDADGRLRPQAFSKKKLEAKASEEDEHEYVEE